MAQDIRKTLYEAYKLDWMLGHGHTIKEMLGKMQERLTEKAIDCTLDYDMSHTIDDLYYEFLEEGFDDGEVFPSYEEFIDNEYQNDDCEIKTICDILSPKGEMFEDYLKDLERL